MTTSTQMAKNQAPRAVIFSGGGSHGAFAVGVMKALAEGVSKATDYQPLDPEIYTGTSVGAYNASFLACQNGVSSREAVGRLEEVWLERISDRFETCGNGVYRVRADPTQFVEPGCTLFHPNELVRNTLSDAAFFFQDGLKRSLRFLASNQPLEIRLIDSIDLSAFFSIEPLQALIADTIDLGALHRSPKKLGIVTSNFEDGTPRVFFNDEIDHSRIQASAAIPGIFPPVVVDGMPLVDGGLVMNTPLKPALKLGAQTLHVIFLDPRVSTVPVADLASTVEVAYRIFLILTALQLRDDLDDARRINASLRLLEEMKKEGAPSRADVQDVLSTAADIVRRQRGGDPYRLLSVHIYVPQSDFGGGATLLDFRRDRTEVLVAAGYRDAETHDCERAGCILPDR